MIDSKLKHTALLVAGCFFMENLDGTIVTTATPALSASLNVSANSVSLVVTAYLITLAVLIPLSGWATKRFGPRPIFLSAIVIFTLASLGCALSQTLPMLVAMRILQGVGGAMMVPVGRMVVLSQTDKQDLIKIVAYIVWPGLIAPVIAPLLGGVITTYLSWHWMFLINVPIGVVAFLVALKIVEAADPIPTERLDVLGVLLTCSALAGITWGAHLIAETTTGIRSGSLIMAAAIVVLAVSVFHLLRTPFPLLKLRTLRVDTFRAAALGFFFFGMVVWSLPFILPLLFQEVLGWTAILSGWAVICVFVGNIMVKPATTWMLNRIGFRPIMIWSTIGVAISIAAFGAVQPGVSFATIAVMAFISGIFRSIGFTTFNTIAFGDVPKGKEMQEANALFATIQQLAAGMGIVLTVLCLRAGASWGGFLPGTALQQQYTLAFLLLGIVSLVPTIISLRLDRDAGNILRNPARVNARQASST